ncbi:MAG TPA: hypothetical protein VKD90_13940 [Gemmataceae bacterium]|nr:hypothetical protein [Gemmataceae bacterium]
MDIRASWFVVLAVLTVVVPAADGGPPERGPMPHLVDLYGDPLPEGAVARLGSVRLRHPGLEDFVLLGDGKTAVTVGRDQLVRRWDLATARQTASARLPMDDSSPVYLALSAGGTTVAPSFRVTNSASATPPPAA